MMEKIKQVWYWAVLQASERPAVAVGVVIVLAVAIVVAVIA